MHCYFSFFFLLPTVTEFRFHCRICHSVLIDFVRQQTKRLLIPIDFLSDLQPLLISCSTSYLQIHSFILDAVYLV